MNSTFPRRGSQYNSTAVRRCRRKPFRNTQTALFEKQHAQIDALLYVCRLLVAQTYTRTCTRRRTHRERVAYVKHLWRTQIAREWFMSLAGGACVCVFTQGPARGRPAVRGFTCVCSPTHGSDTTATADRRAIRPTHCNGENVIISRGCLYYARYACTSVAVSADVRKTKLFSVSYKYAVERSNGRERLDERYARTCVRNGRRFSTDADVGQTFCSRQWLNGPNHKRCT